MSPERLLLAVLTVIALSSSLQHASASADAQSLQDETWTIMVYMAADSYPELYWEPDINEMESADLPETVHVIALVDALGTGDSAIYEISHDPDYLDPTIYSHTVDDGGAVITGGEVDTGSPDTLVSFIGFTLANYPADMTALILWGHGAGWMGLCPDGGDILTLPELRTALEQSEEETGHGIDLLAVDACVEGTLETVYEVKDCADYFVASEKTVPGEGYPYDLIFGDLAEDASMTPQELGGTIVDDFTEWATYASDYCETMTMYDLSEVQGFMDALAPLAAECHKFNLLYDEELYGALWDSESYEDPDSVDLGDLVTELSRDDLPIELRFATLDAALHYSDAVARFGTSVVSYPEDGITIDDATGMVAYVPGNYSFPEYDALQISETAWPRLATALWDDLEPTQPGTGLVLNSTDQDDDGWLDTLQAWWSDGGGTTDLWAFREDYVGVSFHGHVSAEGAAAEMGDLHGGFTISVSSLDGGGIATSHEETTLIFPWEVVLHATAMSPAGAATDSLEAYVLLPDGTEVRAEGSSVKSVSLAVPDQVNYGQMVRVEVRDAEGNLLGWSHAVISSDEVTCEIVVFAAKEDGDGFMTAETAIALAPWVFDAFAIAYILVRLKKGEV